MENKITKDVLLNRDLGETVVSYFSDQKLNLNFKNEFQKIASDIYADIESAYLNPNCSCIQKIKLYVENNKEAVVDFLFEFVEKYSTNEDFLDKLTNGLKNVKQIYLGGTILKTKVSSWKEFSQKINGAIYRSFSVVKEGEDLFVYFL